MIKVQVEARVIDIVNHVGKRGKVEDDYVEAKAEWLPPDKAARKIAGMANAARGGRGGWTTCSVSAPRQPSGHWKMWNLAE